MSREATLPAAVVVAAPRASGPGASGAARSPRGLQSAPDDALFSQMAAGDLAPLGELFDRYHGNVRAFLHTLQVDRADVDDLVQETFLTASRAAEGFHAGASARPYLFGIAARLAWRRRRSFARLRRMLTTWGERPQPAAPSAIDQLEADEQRAALHAGLARLSERHRTVLVMVEFGEMSGVEAAHALGLPAGTVWRQLAEARAQLARQLQPLRPARRGGTP